MATVTIRRVTATVVLAAAGLAAQAGPFDGIYKQAANAECALVGVDGGAVEIAENVFTGVDAACRMTNPVNVVDMDATLYTMACEGPELRWTERAMLMRPAEGEGLIMVWNGYAFVYEACDDVVTVEEAAAAAAAAAAIEVIEEVAVED